jgi:membrane-associated protease RseP (regulator of RpoE activity)
MKTIAITNKPNNTLTHTKTITLALSLALFGSLSARAAQAEQSVSDANPNADQSEAAIRLEMQTLSARMAELSRKLPANGPAGEPKRMVFHVANDGTVQSMDNQKTTVVKHSTDANNHAEGARLGLVLMSGTGVGVAVAAVTPGSGAEKAGIKTGDELVSLGGTALPATDTLQATRKILSNLKAGEALAVGVKRGGQTLSLNVTASNLPKVMVFSTSSQQGAMPNLESLSALSPEIQATVTAAIASATQTGATTGGANRQIIRINLPGGVNNSDLDLTTLNPDLAKYFGARDGVLALDVKGYPPLLAGDVITQIDGVVTPTPGAVFAALGKKAGQTSQVDVIRQKSNRTLSVQVPTHPMPPTPPVPPAPVAAPAAPTPPAPPRG